ncbi:M18 family aminopeptidase [Corynebacterium sp. sy017]|uniref:M18 family aminopeptidase n=1 Tax=unclassified Corynebacterium TaxID=2624378 RepID=UPI001185C3C9|nr:MULTISPECIES: M18 family aminopeptidase [unclassified Corynebacterium]MBP3087612.1 M18 family aminopeptidase [Corynebacterium sp. sy017]QDZ42607.1 M18 family aminopeptidase [Corynebacterium sp. sy039]TSD92180.1 M18 family aminopeptidase [Corynebacterium sp. SY003]
MSTKTSIEYEHAQDFLDFISCSPSSYHAASCSAFLLEAAGFIRHEEQQAWDVTPGGHFIVRGGALMAWYVPDGATAESGFRIIGAHNDSPGFKLKPKSDFTSHQWQQVAVEVYGGPLLSSWFDRELKIAGIIGLADGSTQLISTQPLLRIPNLAIHLDRSNSVEIDRQQHTQPIFAVSQPQSNILEVIAKEANVAASDIVSHDLITVDAQPGQIFGTQQDFLAAGRLDNLSSVFSGLNALIRASYDAQTNDILVFAAFDHEEIGSGSATGAAGPILHDVLERTGYALGADAEQLHRMYARSSCISADAAHSIHPNYAHKHDPANHPILGQGPVLKTNANQRYATSASMQALWHKVCRQAGYSSQIFAGNNAIPCGSTIGPITATRLGIPTVDVGIPLLSMHSARELASAHDMYVFTEILYTYLVG